MNRAQNYKVLYEALAGQSAEKDNLIVLLQQQLMQMAGERHTLTAVIAYQQAELINHLGKSMRSANNLITNKTSSLASKKNYRNSKR